MMFGFQVGDVVECKTTYDNGPNAGDIGIIVDVKKTKYDDICEVRFLNTKSTEYLSEFNLVCVRVKS